MEITGKRKELWQKLAKVLRMPYNDLEFMMISIGPETYFCAEDFEGDEDSKDVIEALNLFLNKVFI